MAKCRVLRSVPGWNRGDEVELFGDRKLELAQEGIVEIVIDDEIPVVVNEKIEEAVRPKRRRGRKVVN